jgi:anhydro-N-acetylmuramic acid kinase
MDAIDSALVQFKNDQSVLAEYQQYPIDRNTQKRLRSISATTPLEEIERLDIHLGALFADTVKALIHRANIDHELVTAIGSHGQTVLHEPNAPEPFSLQIGNPNLIAYKTGITTVADFRGLDIAAGGQGAPLAPAFHQFQFQHPEKNRVILNIGGMANITILPADSSEPVSGFDTGPGNVLMDEWIRQHQDQLMDHNGHWASTGTVQADLLAALMDDPYFHVHPPKTTGRDYFNLTWLNHYLTRLENRLEPADVQATLLALTAKTIADAILNYAPNTEETLVCGGGFHNRALIDEIEKILSGCTFGSTDMEGLDPDCIEAITFAWLAKCRIEGKPGNLPSVTGAKSAVVLGAIYEPGNK